MIGDQELAHASAADVRRLAKFLGIATANLSEALIVALVLWAVDGEGT